MVIARCARDRGLGLHSVPLQRVARLQTFDAQRLGADARRSFALALGRAIGKRRRARSLQRRGAFAQGIGGFSAVWRGVLHLRRLLQDLGHQPGRLWQFWMLAQHVLGSLECAERAALLERCRGIARFFQRTLDLRHGVRRVGRGSSATSEKAPRSLAGLRAAVVDCVRTHPGLHEM